MAFLFKNVFTLTTNNLNKIINYTVIRFKIICLPILGHNITFDSFYNLYEIYEYIDRLPQERSDFVEVINIGYTFEGAPLKIVKISPDKNVQPPNTVWIDGGIHGREWISVSSVLYVIHRLIYERDSLEAHMKNTEFHILPIVNPDGSVLIYRQSVGT